MVDALTGGMAAGKSTDLVTFILPVSNGQLRFTLPICSQRSVVVEMSRIRPKLIVTLAYEPLVMALRTFPANVTLRGLPLRMKSVLGLVGREVGGTRCTAWVDLERSQSSQRPGGRCRDWNCKTRGVIRLELLGHLRVRLLPGTQRHKDRQRGTSSCKKWFERKVKRSEFGW